MLFGLLLFLGGQRSLASLCGSLGLGDLEQRAQGDDQRSKDNDTDDAAAERDDDAQEHQAVLLLFARVGHQREADAVVLEHGLDEQHQVGREVADAANVHEEHHHEPQGVEVVLDVAHDQRQRQEDAERRDLDAQRQQHGRAHESAAQRHQNERRPYFALGMLRLPNELANHQAKLGAEIVHEREEANERRGSE